MNQDVCVFAAVPDEKPRHNEKMYTCVHGKTLSWDTARRLLKMSHGLVQYVQKSELPNNS